MRASGVLLPVFSLPGKYGIGCFSKEAYRFVDFLREAGQKFWQILPLGPTGFGDSPYQSFSTFAGNPYFISPDILVEKGLLTQAECKAYDFGKNKNRIDYEKLYQSRYLLLEKAFERADLTGAAYQRFVRENEFWLHDYALFMVCKDAFHGKPLEEWDTPYRMREKKALEALEKQQKRKVEFYYFIQYEFFCQWSALKSYANKKGIRIIGDIPIYVSADGSDIWGCPEAFQVDEENYVTAVAGCPPDSFAKDGQLWGNPLYDWSYHKRTGYRWWIRRFQKCLEMYDVIRIDHFRGFDAYYSIPAGSTTAANGAWKEGPGIELFRAIEDALGKMEIIAEDLGYMTDSVKKLVQDTGYPNMKVLQFAFDSRTDTEGTGGVNEYLPFLYDKNCAVYTGTHDNETLLGYLKGMEENDRKMMRAYFGASERCTNRKLAQMFLRMAHSSVAEYCIIPLQDYLYLDNRARINEPSTTGDNWCFRVQKEDIDKGLAKRIAKLTEIYGR